MQYVSFKEPDFNFLERIILQAANLLLLWLI